MIVKFAEISSPEFKKAIKQLLHGHLVVYDDICWLQIRRKKTLVVTCAPSRFSKDNLTQELAGIATVLANLMDASEYFKLRLDSLRLAIFLVDRLDRNRKQICTVYAASTDDLGRSNYDVKWPLSPEEVKTRIALRKKKAKAAAIEDRRRSISAFGLVLLMFFCVGAIAYFSAGYFASESVSVAVGYTVIAFGLELAGSTVVEFVIAFGIISLPAYFIFTGFPRTQIMGFDIDIVVSPEQFLRAALIGLVLGLLTGLLAVFFGSSFFD